jgi:hypothetical protein
MRPGFWKPDSLLGILAVAAEDCLGRTQGPEVLFWRAELLMEAQGEL